MSNTFQFLTYSGFRISTGAGYEILVDPFLDDNPDTQFQSTDFEKVDLILATHGAYDHVGDTGKIACFKTPRRFYFMMRRSTNLNPEP